MPYVKPAHPGGFRTAVSPFPLLPAAGAHVAMDPYWTKHLILGNVVFAEDPTAVPGTSKEADAPPAHKSGKATRE